MPMQIVAKKTIVAFWAVHPRAQSPLETWHVTVKKAAWTGPADVRATYNSADFVGDNRVIFNIGGNNYRLVAHINYQFKTVLIKFIGTHREYDKINPETV